MKVNTNRNRQQALLLTLAIMVSLFIPGMSISQVEQKTIPDGTEGEVFVIPPKDSLNTKKKQLEWNEFDLKFTTIKLGLGLLYEYAAFAQDEEAEAQMDSANVDLESQFKLRDFRFLVSGRLNTKRTITWKAGLMYDGVTGEWFVRETGIIIGVPEISGNIFIGRTKEGFSLNKVMNGYAGWTMERQMALDVIPILADGIKYFGFLPKSRIFWNVGAFTDWFSEGQTFSKFNWQYDARVGWMPFYNQAEKRLLHVGASVRYAQPLNGSIQVRSKPEADPAPYFIDTGKFSTDHSSSVGGEVYYSSGSLMLGSEFYMHAFSSATADDPKFYGAEVVATYIFTGESRPYNTAGSIYGFVPVKKPVFKGGLGAWEGVIRISTLDLDGGNLQGGKFWRLTPMVNWYLSKNVRIEMAYGYGILNRFHVKGNTQFFQSRIQFMIS